MKLETLTRPQQLAHEAAKSVQVAVPETAQLTTVATGQADRYVYSFADGVNGDFTVTVFADGSVENSLATEADGFELAPPDQQPVEIGTVVETPDPPKPPVVESMEQAVASDDGMPEAPAPKAKGGRKSKAAQA